MSLYIVKRDTAKGRRFHVRYQVGRYEPIVHLGVFDTEKRAKLRIEAAKDELAAGRKPQKFVPVDAPVVEDSIAVVGAAWVETLHDLAPSTLAYYTRSVRVLDPEIAALTPSTITYLDLQAWITRVKKHWAPGTISRELTILRMLLDHAGIRDNPASDKRLRRPKKQRREYRIPNRRDILRLHEVMPTRRDLLTLLEHTGMRIHEAASLRWRDIDYARDRLLVVKSKTAAGRRFIERLPDSPPFPEPRPGASPDDRVFANPGAMSLTNALREAHIKHGIALYSAHDFRHGHASRLLHEGVLSPAQIAERMGHSTPAMTLGTYAHVVPPD